MKQEGVMDQTITLQALVQCAALIVGIWGFVKIIMEIVKAIEARHDKEMEWNKTKEDLEKGRQEIIERYDKKLGELEKMIIENYAQTEAKIQELNACNMLLTKSIRAILAGQIEQGLNGPVKEAKKALDEFIDSKAFD